MTIGVTINGAHSLTYYAMWLTNVDVEQAEVQSHYVQVPGRDGELDLTEALTGDVRYYNGTITMTFQTAKSICGRTWLEQLNLVSNNLHGKRAEIQFDDSDETYSGRCEVSGTPIEGGVFEIEVAMTVDNQPTEIVAPGWIVWYQASTKSLMFAGTGVDVDGNSLEIEG